jgi:hypothetical protein
MHVVRRWGDRQLRADRLAPIIRSVLVNERDHLSVDGRAPHGRKKLCLAQDIFGTLQLKVLAFELLEALLFRTRQPGAFTLVTFGMPYLFFKVSAVHPISLANRSLAPPLRFVFRLVLKHHSYRTFPNLG